MGVSVNGVRLMTTTIGGFFAGVGGAFLSLSYPGSWNQGLSSGQGLMAVALVIFARWSPLRCVGAALLFGAAGAIGPALQSIGVTQGYYFFNAAPYILTLVIMIATSSAKHAARRHAGRTHAWRNRHADDRSRPLSLALQRRPAAGKHGHRRHRHADGFLRRRRLCRQDGLRPLADARADRADQGAARRRAGEGLSHHPHARGPSARTCPTCRPTNAGARAASAPASAMPAPAAKSWCAASPAGRSSPISRRFPARSSSTSPARARSAPPISS